MVYLWLFLTGACVGQISAPGDQPDAHTALDAQADDAGAGAPPDGSVVSVDAGTLEAGVDAADAGPSARLMYVSVGAEPRLAVAVLNADGTMDARPTWDLTLSGTPGAMTYDRTRRRLYVGVRPGSIATITLSPDGQPTVLGETTGAGFPVYLATAHDGAVLITAYFNAATLLTHRLDGPPPHALVDTATTTAQPHQALVAPNAKVYVPHRSSDRTRWYAVDPNGNLTYEDELIAPAGAGPRHIIFSSDGARGYLVHELADSITPMAVQADGSLISGLAVTTLPSGFDPETNTCADVHIAGDGRLVFVSNRGHDSIAGFRVLDDGALSPLGTTATEARPREFAVSPDERFLVVAGQDSGFLQSFRIEDDGQLTGIDRLEVGDDLRWVIID